MHISIELYSTARTTGKKNEPGASQAPSLIWRKTRRWVEQIAGRPSEFKALANEKIIKNILILFVNNQIGKLPDDAGRACVQQSPSPVFFFFLPFPRSLFSIRYYVGQRGRGGGGGGRRRRAVDRFKFSFLLIPDFPWWAPTTQKLLLLGPRGRPAGRGPESTKRTKKKEMVQSDWNTRKKGAKDALQQQQRGKKKYPGWWME